MDTLKSELRRLLNEVASLPEGFNENVDFYTDLGVSSMKAIELLLALEDRYDVRVPDEEFIRATSLELLTHLMRRLKIQIKA